MSVQHPTVHPSVQYPSGPYPASTATALHPAPAEADPRLIRPVVYAPRRRRWPALLAATLIGGAVAALYVSTQYDGRSLGARLDDTVSAAGSNVDRGVNDLRGAASGAAAGTAGAAERVAGALYDTGITAAVKTALAADPGLSALKVEVNTRDGVVRLEGPAPDEKARERAGVLASAPDGVRQVDNRLVVQPAR